MAAASVSCLRAGGDRGHRRPVVPLRRGRCTTAARCLGRSARRGGAAVRRLRWRDARGVALVGSPVSASPAAWPSGRRASADHRLRLIGRAQQRDAPRPARRLPARRSRHPATPVAATELRHGAEPVRSAARPTAGGLTTRRRQLRHDSERAPRCAQPNDTGRDEPERQDGSTAQRRQGGSRLRTRPFRRRAFGSTGPADSHSDVSGSQCRSRPPPGASGWLSVLQSTVPESTIPDHATVACCRRPRRDPTTSPRPPRAT